MPELSSTVRAAWFRPFQVAGPRGRGRRSSGDDELAKPQRGSRTHVGSRSSAETLLPWLQPRPRNRDERIARSRKASWG